MKYKMPKSMREKRRYLEVRIVTPSSVDEEGLRRVLWEALLGALGEVGAAKTQAWVLEWDPAAGTGFIRCAIPSVDEVIFSLKTVTAIGGTPANIIIEGVSGTLKSLRTTPPVK